MISKLKEKERALSLREKGRSYSEILKVVPVAKSTLSLWLRSVGLSKRQKQRLTMKRLAAMKRGWEACNKKRILLTKKIKRKAKKEIGKIHKRDLHLIGIALYWAEGHKEKFKGSLVQFGNSDPKMIKVFLKWLKKICKIKRKEIRFWIFLHETARHKLIEVQKYWSKVTKFPIGAFEKVSWKKNKLSYRKNRGEKYYGVLRVVVGKSTNLNRTIQGWINGIEYNLKV